MAKPSMRQPLLAIRRDVEKLRRLDSARSVHGSRGHRYDQLPPLTEAELSDVEAAYGVTLPEALGEFLLHVNGGGAGPGYGIYIPRTPEELAELQLREPFPYGNAAATALLQRRAGERFAMLPRIDLPNGKGFAPGALPVAHFGCGAFALLIVTGEQRGQMWCVDMGYCPIYDGVAGTPGPRGQFDFLTWYEDWLARSFQQLSRAS
jgi:hypothetical protein